MFAAGIFRRSPAKTILSLFILVLFLSGCAKLSASHLQLKPGNGSGSQKLEAKFMRFEFMTAPNEQGLTVSGSASPIRANLPAWADSVDSLSIHAYLCDENGFVLASATKSFTAQNIPASGFPFALQLKHPMAATDKFFVSFGYGGMFTASKPPASGGQGSGGISGNYVFFANEQAVLTK